MFRVSLLFFLASDFLVSTSAFSSVILPPRFLKFENGICTRAFTDGERSFSMRNVQGDGNCMLAAVHLAAEATVLGWKEGRSACPEEAKRLRATIAEILSSEGTLYIEDDRIVSTTALLNSAANQEGLSPDEYLDKLSLDGPEGGMFCGGPELTVLSNLYRRPISIYELDDAQFRSMITEKNTISIGEDTPIPIDKRGTFGLNLFEDPCVAYPGSAVATSREWHIHVLVLDVSAKEKHACVLLPEVSIENKR
jgi:hypothetical protein